MDGDGVKRLGERLVDEVRVEGLSEVSVHDQGKKRSTELID